MMRPSVQGVDPPVCCTPGCYCYICKRQFCGFTGRAFCPLEGGAQISWMLLLHMQETVLWIHRPGLLSSRGGGPDILDVTVTYARDSFVDSPAGPFVLSRGGPDILAPVLQLFGLYKKIYIFLSFFLNLLFLSLLPLQACTYLNNT